MEVTSPHSHRPWCHPSLQYDVWSFVTPKVSIAASKPRNRTTDTGLLTFSGKAYVGVLLQPGHPPLEIRATVLDSATVSDNTLVVIE